MASIRTKSVLLSPVARYVPGAVIALVLGGLLAAAATWKFAGRAYASFINSREARNLTVASNSTGAWGIEPRLQTDNRLEDLLDNVEAALDSAKTDTAANLLEAAAKESGAVLRNGKLPARLSLLSDRLALVNGDLNTDKTAELEKIVEGHPEFGDRAAALLELAGILWRNTAPRDASLAESLRSLGWKSELVAAGQALMGMQLDKDVKARWLECSWEAAVALGDEGVGERLAVALGEVSGVPERLMKTADYLAAAGKAAAACRIYEKCAAVPGITVEERRSAVRKAVQCSMDSSRSAGVQRIFARETDGVLRVEIAISLGKESLRGNYPTRALRLFTDALDSCNKLGKAEADRLRPRALGGYMRALTASGRHIETRMLAETLLDEKPVPAVRALYEISLADAYAAAGDFEKALKLYRKIADNDCGAGLAGEAVEDAIGLYRNLGRKAEAERLFRNYVLNDKGNNLRRVTVAAR